MVTSIARQSVILKCKMQKSVLTGNYEFYYAAGLAAKLAGLSLDEELRPKELAEAAADVITNIEKGDERTDYLCALLSGDCPSEEYDGQMKELFLMGVQEQRLWKV